MRFANWACLLHICGVGNLRRQIVIRFRLKPSKLQERGRLYFFSLFLYLIFDSRILNG